MRKLMLHQILVQTKLLPTGLAHKVLAIQMLQQVPLQRILSREDLVAPLDVTPKVLFNHF